MQTNLKKLHEDPTLNGEGKLQGFLRKIKGKGLFNDNAYKKIYPSCCNPAHCTKNEVYHYGFLQ